MNCPKCNSSMVKGGKTEDKQRYKCKECGYNYYNVEIKSTAKSKTLKSKRLALHLYLDGLDPSSIGRILGVSDASVLKWIKEFGQKAQELVSEEPQIKMVGVDEMYSYVGSKKTTAGHRMLLIDMDKDSSVSFLATEKKKQKNLGKNKS